MKLQTQSINNIVNMEANVEQEFEYDRIDSTQEIFS